MALIARDSAASMDASTGMFAQQLTGLVAGENLDAVAPCYIKTADGKLYMSNGTALNEAAEFVGMTPHARLAGEAVTVFGIGARFHYSASLLSPGDKYFVGATAGRLDTAATTGGTVAIARAVTSTDIVVIKASE